jgi:hypothetical protein
MSRGVVVLSLLTVSATACRTQEGAPAPTPPSVTATQTVSPAATLAAPSSIALPRPPASSGNAEARTFRFDADTSGSPPAGFTFGRTGQGRDGRWLVVTEADAPSAPNVLGQTDTDPTDYRFPIAIGNEVFAADVELSVKCKPVSGAVDRACGMVLRLKDANNYYLTRANALENNVRLYFVKDGHRQQIASWSGPVTSGTWHDYRIAATGDHFEVAFDGAKVIDHRDSTFGDGGHVGVWTKADSVTYFDNLTVRPL